LTNSLRALAMLTEISLEPLLMYKLQQNRQTSFRHGQNRQHRGCLLQIEQCID